VASGTAAAIALAVIGPMAILTQGKIERWHETLKNRMLLENYFLFGDLEAQIAAFVSDYNHHGYHESIDNLTPADVYFGRGPSILAERERIKRQTIANRRLQHRLRAAPSANSRGCRSGTGLSRRPSSGQEMS
jgi:hypothetical protein